MSASSRIPAPEAVEAVGDFIAIRWPGGREDILPMEKLRAASPSAEQQGEKDILGKIHGGSPLKDFPGVRIEGWEWIGGYALRFRFSDGHQTGLYSFDYLQRLGDAWEER
jgi:DUF971 family protein